MINLISHVDDVYPSDLKRVQDYDSDKISSIEELVRISNEIFTDFNVQSNFLLTKDPFSFVSLKHLSSLVVGFKTYWMNDPDNPSTRIINSKRDFRYNLNNVIQIFSKIKPLELDNLNNHCFFAMNLTLIFSKIASITTSKDIPLITKVNVKHVF